VNDLAHRPGRSRFAPCVRRFATRVCVRGGLSEWARGEVLPMRWPTVAATSAACLSEHRETSRPEGLRFTVPAAELHELISNRGASAEIRTAPRARDAEVSGDESE
jgi:hypothetical protein